MKITLLILATLATSGCKTATEQPTAAEAAAETEALRDLAQKGVE